MAGEKEFKGNFEDLLHELEAVVNRLEEGELQLEEALTLFEKGVCLSRHCYKKLQEVERKIELLVSSGNGEEIVEFTLEGEN